MPEPATTRDPRVVEAKLYPGISTRDPLARPQLDPPREFLDGAATVAVLCAPAGYGKTTVMAGWHTALRAAGFGCAWLSLDADDNDPARFLRHLVAALRIWNPTIGDDVLAQLFGLQTGSVKPLLESLAADLGRLGRRSVLFLDDLHFAVHPDVLEIADWLINYSPRNLQFVLGARGEPPLRLSGLRVRRQLIELRGQDLQMTAGEATRFLDRRLQRTLDPAVLEKVLRKTEGWPAALELMAAAMRSATNADELVGRFARSDRGVVDYLGEMVLGGLGPDLRDFVESMALFDRFSASLAAHVTGARNATAKFSELRARHLFLVPMDDGGEWFRFHHLVGEYFREHPPSGSLDRQRQMLAAGARWLFERGAVEEAINTAIRAREFDMAAQYLAQSVEELVFRRGYHATLAHWMAELPDESVDRYPAIRINYAFSLGFHPMQIGVEAQLHRLERIATHLAQAPRHDTAAIDGIRCAVELQRLLLHPLRDEGRLARDEALAWLDRWPDALPLQKGHAANALAFGHKTLSEIAAGLAVVAQGRRWHQQSEGWYGLSWMVVVEALLLLKQGAYREAQQVCESGLTLIDQHLAGNRVHASILRTLLATVAYEFDEPDRAEAHMEQAMRSVQDYGPADAVILAYLTQARLRFLRSDPVSAHAILAEGQAVGAQRGLDRVVLTLAAEECTWLGREGRFEEAQEAALRSGILRLGADPVPTPGLITEKSARVALRLNLRDDPTRTLAALGTAVEHCRRLDLQHRLTELHGLRALVLHRQGRTGEALDELATSLRIAAQRQYLRVYLDEGAEIADLLRLMSTDPDRHPETMPLARRLLRSFDRAAKREPAKAGLAEGLFGELTRREINLLKRLESGMSNREIAESVFITEGTLKWHLSNIYSKLGTKNRFGALAKARSVGLI